MIDPTQLQHAMDEIPTLVARLAERLLARRQWLAVAESCTGGLIAAHCTDLAGSSGWFERGLVTYSNTAKQALLGVPETVLQQQGAVSEACVRAMAAGLLAHAPVQYGVAVSGIAGPTGGSVQKPVGTVWIGWASPAGVSAQGFHFAGDRSAVRVQTVRAGLKGLLRLLDDPQ